MNSRLENPLLSQAEPFYFESAGQQIFGLYHPPTGVPRGEGVVICYPLPQEMMRSYTPHVQLSRALAELGYAVLRFDYSATGDSDGSSASMSLDHWEANVLSALHQMKKRGWNRLNLIGTRLGAMLALRASACVGIRQLVLWDPIIDGIDYLHALEASHHQLLHREPLDNPKADRRYSPEQCWGFPWNASWRQQLAAISPALVETYAHRVHLVLSEAHAKAPALFEALLRKGVVVEQHVVGEAIHWADDRYLKNRAFPTLNLRMISRIMGES